MSTRAADVKELREGKFVVIDGEPCKVMSIQTAKTGKHGSAKARVDAIGLFDGQKRSLVSPNEASCEVPLIEKRSVQVIAFMGDKVQLMDLETYENYELPRPKKGEMEGDLVEGCEVEVLQTMGRRKILRVR